MRLGATFPTSELGGDAGAVRAFGEAAEELGYRFVLAFDHVLGAAAKPDRPVRAYGVERPVHEPFVLLSFLAGATRHLELVTGVIILPQRQTVLVAKQAAELDCLCEGRLRLGVGIGWNTVEYEALGENFNDRVLRYTEQIELMRTLWTNEVVDFNGRWHRVDHAGLNPMPVQRPIPVWIGGWARPALSRALRIGDGWIAYGDPGALAADVEWIRSQRADYPIMGSITAGDDKALDRWVSLGVDELTVTTMGLGLASVDDHIDALRRHGEARSRDAV